MDEARGLKALWRLGAVGALVIGGELLGFGLLAALPLALAAELMARESLEGVVWALYCASRAARNR